MIEVKNLVKKYGNQLALDHLNLNLEKGKIYGFLGPNGAGKSTTMNIMTGYLAASDGDVVIDGYSISDEPEKAKKCIGYLPEIPPLYTEMKVREYITFAAEIKKIPKAQRQDEVNKAIRIAKLENVSEKLIKHLSKGYKQRVGLAQAVIGMPDIIILDEPTVGLDPKQIIEIRKTIRSLGQGRTVILSSHIMQEVSAVCDYIIIISNGQLMAYDTPENLSKLCVEDNIIEMTVKGDKEDVKSILHTLPDIKRYKVGEVQEKGCFSFTVTSDHDVDIREKLFKAFARSEYPILEMHLQRLSLEEIFLEITGEGDSKLKLAALKKYNTPLYEKITSRTVKAKKEVSANDENNTEAKEDSSNINTDKTDMDSDSILDEDEVIYADSDVDAAVDGDMDLTVYTDTAAENIDKEEI